MRVPFARRRADSAVLVVAQGLSATTVVRVHASLRKAHADVEQHGLVWRNVASKVKPPRENRPEIEPLTVEDAKRLLGAFQGTRHEGLYAVMLMMGLRVGEVLGLAWGDVDLEAKTLRVRRQVRRERESFISRRQSRSAHVALWRRQTSWSSPCEVMSGARRRSVYERSCGRTTASCFRPRWGG